MNLIVQRDPRPEAMSDVPGVCELPLTRALVQYRDVHETETAGGRIRDIGLALVLDGRYASSAEALDLGSADVKLLDLSAELVVLDWAYEPTLEHTRTLLGEAASSGDRRSLQRFCFRIALRVLERLGYGALTRSTLMRIGYRDICRDLDLHEGTSVRIVMESGRIVRVHLDYDANALLCRTATAERDPLLEAALEQGFPTGDVRRLAPLSEGASGGYQVRFSLPLSLDEAREAMADIRRGILALIGRFEPERLGTLEGLSGALGHRDTLAHLNLRPAAIPTVALERTAEDVLASPRGNAELRAGSFGSLAVH